MKSKYLLFLKMQLYNLFGINRIIYSHSKKEKQRSIICGALAVFFIGLMTSYSTGISISMANMGITNLLPTISVLICSLITLILTFLKSTGVLIGMRDYDMVMSLPVKSIEVILSRLTMVYLTNLLISIIIVLPSVIIWGLNAEKGIVANIVFFLSLLFLPIIPMIISLGASFLIFVVSSKVKHKNILSLILSTLVVLTIMLASVKAQSMNSNEIIDIGILVSNITNRLYPPATLISIAIEKQNWLYFLLFVGISILSSIIFIGIVAHFYQEMNTTMFNNSFVKYESKSLKASSPFKAMYKREFERYFSCTIYALNSTIGMVLLLVVSLISLFINPKVLEQQSGITGLTGMICNVLPFVISLFVTMTSTTSASLSLEGKNRWVMCSVPVYPIQIYNSKIAVNLTVIFPFTFLSIILFSIKLKVSLVEFIILCIVPTIYAFFISILGMYMNVKFPKYDWPSEYYAVKGGAISVLITMGIGMLSSVVPLFLCIAFQQISGLIIILISALMLFISLGVYRRLQQYPLYEM